MLNGTPSIDSNTICPVELKAEQWEIVLKALGKFPYEISAPIIQLIVPQVLKYGTSSHDLAGTNKNTEIGAI